jgi:hypothetical protein
MVLTTPCRIFVFDGPDEAYVSFLKGMRATIQREIETWEHSFPSSHQEAPTSDDLRIVPFDPPAIDDQPSKKQKPKPKPILSQPVPPRWKIELDAFLASLPTNLPSSKEAVGLSGNMVALNVLLAVDTTSTDQTHSPSAWTAPFTFLETATQYALTTRKLRACAQFAILCARFREVILGCLSVVLHKDKGYKGLGNAILQEGFGNTLKEESCHRLRRGARFANRCVSKLSSTNWKHQSSELIYLSKFGVCLIGPVTDWILSGGRSLDQYARISESSKSCGIFDEYLENLKWKDTNELSDELDTPSDYGSSGNIPISIPCIIKCLVGNEIG